MKIKTEMYGVFYKDNGVWRGPVDGRVLPKNKLESVEYEGQDYLTTCKKTLKKKVKLFKQVWKSVKV